ncbi:hypothetical protein BpHYR1_026502 [Brachionus plicatilis]|uniref:Uncharacterized protein n=1 Tax=Brachionus plicatilis TaxID=10195 RepID=A0A3M7PB22_BRAPC|nr:hypothetical protein BpHYR1_026502 [Brachionus plicatilis]
MCLPFVCLLSTSKSSEYLFFRCRKHNKNRYFALEGKTPLFLITPINQNRTKMRTTKIGSFKFGIDWSHISKLDLDFFSNNEIKTIYQNFSQNLVYIPDFARNCSNNTNLV